MLHHEIEMDETYVTHCRKGRFIKDHPGKKRGTCASRAGLSDEKVCIITAVQRLGKCIARSLNVSKPSIKNVEDFCQSVANKSYVWTDGLQSYTKVLREKKCTNKVLNTYSEYGAVNHLNNVNSFHSILEPNRAVIDLFVVHFTPPVSVCQLSSLQKVLFLHGIYKLLQTTF